MWQHYVAIGDSFTEGIGDTPDSEGRLRGWAGRVAQRLADHNPAFRFENLARRGLTSKLIRASQLEPALQLQPDLVSIVAGANDVLKNQWDARQYEADMRAMFEPFVERGVTISTGTIPPFPFLPVPPKVMERFDQRFLETNAIIRQLAAEYGLVLLDMFAQPEPRQRDFWSDDFIHPTAQGYEQVADLVWQRLATARPALARL